MASNGMGGLPSMNISGLGEKIVSVGKGALGGTSTPSGEAASRDADAVGSTVTDASKADTDTASESMLDKATKTAKTKLDKTSADKAANVKSVEEEIKEQTGKSLSISSIFPSKPSWGLLLGVGAAAALILAVKALLGLHTPKAKKLEISLGGDLTGQGFLPPDFNIDHLKHQIRQTMAASRRAAEALDKAEDASTVAAEAFEQAARHADRVGRLPGTHSPPNEAWGEADGFFPPRRTWGSKFL